MPHPGQEPRPADAYFMGARPHAHSQGDIRLQVPYFLAPTTLGADVTVVARDVMLVTRSCDLDRHNRPVHVAPLTTTEARVPAHLIDELRAFDCFHDCMYLPAESDYAERLVNLAAIQSVTLDVLARCQLQTRLTYVASQQLQRKLALHWTGLHIARADFRPPADDF